MSNIRWIAELLQPAELVPDSTAEVIVQYNNPDEYDHQIRKISISPTWDLTQEFESSNSVDIEVPSGEMKRLPAIEVTVPRGIGGKQGFRVGVEVCRQREDDQAEYKEEWDDAILRVDVRDFDTYRPLLCVSGDNKGETTLRRFIHDWGFDSQEVYEQQDIIAAFKENDETPVAVFGVVFPGDEDTPSRHLLSSAVSTALSYDVIALVFKHADADLPSLPDDCIIIEFDPNEKLRLEKEGGPSLLGIRALEETGQMSTFVQWMKKVVEKAAKKPRELLNSWVNKVILSTIGATAAGEDLVAKIKDLFWSGSSTVPTGIKLLDIERFNEGEPNVERITFVAQNDLNLFGWTMETEYAYADTYHFDDVHLSVGEIYDATNQYVGFLDYEIEDTITVYDAYGRVVLEETISSTPFDSHCGIFRVIDEERNPIEGEPVRMVNISGGKEVFKTDDNGEVAKSYRAAPADGFYWEVTVRGQTESLHIARGTIIVEFVIHDDGSVDSTIMN